VATGQHLPRPGDSTASDDFAVEAAVKTGEWSGRLRCPFCGERDHERLSSLVSQGLERQTVDVCDRCRHYLKAFAAQTPIRPERVFLQDLATLVLDVAALERGYRRPAAKGRRVEVIARPARMRTLLRLRRLDARVNR